jgi:multidrug efflux pump subunit AcrA (membrane-fusion protein)
MKVALAMVLVLLCGCGKKAETEAEKEPVPAVMVEPVVRGAIDRLISADAVLYPVNQANVTPKISAPVRRVLVNRGDHVRAGQLLAELESADLASAAEEARNQYEQSRAAYQTVTGATVVDDRTKAQADVTAAQSAVDVAKKLYDNRVALQKEGALAQKLVDDARLTYVQAQSQLATAQRHLETLNQVSQQQAIRGAEAQMDAAKAHHESAVVQSSYARVVSPISGVVADRPVYPGELASTGSPIASIVDISKVVARTNIPVNDALYVKVGAAARVTGPEGDLAGKVTVVSPATNPNSTTLEVWVEIANPEEKLKPGASVHVTIIATTLRDVIIAPASALLNGDGGKQKMIVIGKDSVSQERPVTIGVRQGDRVQVLSGVQEGDRVVTSGGLGLEDKVKVTIQEAKEDEDDEDSAEEPAAKSDAKGKTGK